MHTALRQLKKYKNSFRMSRLSIITVNYNSGPLLEKTLQALVDFAKHPDIEIVVVDGGSQDVSRLTVETYRKVMGHCIVERDSGIYDAMNKGIKVSKGDWIWFINAGDVPIIAPDVGLSHLVEAERKKANYIYSDLLINGVTYQQNFSLRYLATRMINHQSSIYRRNLLKDLYDISYNYCADYAHLLKNFKQVIPFKIPDLLCSYDLTGISSVVSRRRRLAIWFERLRAQLNAPLNPFIKLGLATVSLVVILIKSISPGVGSVVRKS